MLQIHNSLSRQKEPFKPRESGKISLYVCGITVYDRCHLGHARFMVAFDVIVRFLRAAGYQVLFVRNITDIDDKIIDRAQARNISIEELTAEFIQAMHEDAAALGLLAPNQEPRATAYIPQMLTLIQRLMDKGLAYVSEDGDVCFEVGQFKSYGCLSHQDLSGLLSGARVQVNEHKRSPLDFVLWKKSKPGEPFWPSPWGDGRPGWHLECSAMSMDLLGEQFDIHGGGGDLRFPHHENEIAQSEGATGKRFANYWLHTGMLQVNHEKMAKSTGNFFTIEAVLKKYPAEVIRYFLLSSQYRSDLNYSEDALMAAHKALMRLYQSLRDKDLEHANHKDIDSTWRDRFFSVMNDDFNTPEALSVLFELSHALNKNPSASLAVTLKYLGGILGLLQADPAVFLQTGLDEAERKRIEALIVERVQARSEKSWARADEIRKQLQEEGIELEDNAIGTTWRYIYQ